MREIIVAKWCDGCWQDGEQKVQATRTFAGGVVEGETRPVIKSIETCDVHAKQFDDLLLLLEECNPLDPAAIAKPPKRVAASAPTGPPSTAMIDCPICDRTMTGTQSLVGHIWSQHASKRKPAAPLQCPDCGQEFGNASSCGVHRSVTHNFDPVRDALSFVKGYRLPR